MDQVTLIPLYGDRGQTVAGYTLVDAPDAAWLGRWHWRINPYGYAVRSEPRSSPGPTTVFMHRELLGLSAGDPREGDHINRNRLDNRRANLRIVTRAQNRQNLPPHPFGASAHRGVSWDTSMGKWRATARLNGRKKHLGYFTDEAEAGRVAAEWRAANMPYSAEAGAVDDNGTAA